MSGRRREKYGYHVSGTNATGQSWDTKGELAIPPGNVPLAVEYALRETFLQLTEGRAVYGYPGIGCEGPYRITRLLIQSAE